MLYTEHKERKTATKASWMPTFLAGYALLQILLVMFLCFNHAAFPQFLNEKYVLDTDLQYRFKSLTTLPKRYNLNWPRYLYRYAPNEAGSQN